MGVKSSDDISYTLVKKSIDARKHPPMFQLRYMIGKDEEILKANTPSQYIKSKDTNPVIS